VLNVRSARRSLPVLLAGLLSAAAFSASASASATWGELSRFTGVGTGGGGHKFLLSERTHAFGVNAGDNSIYVGDELNSEEENNTFRIQKYDEGGQWQAEAKIKPLPSEPAGLQGIVDLQGVAVDPALERIYVLVVYSRSGKDAVDPGLAVAGAVYAFKTTQSGKKLVPATGANAEGLLISPSTLNAGSEALDGALLHPGGLAVNPKTHELLILGQVDEGEAHGGLHLAVDRFGSLGEVKPAYVAPTALNAEATYTGEPGSPVVSAAGTVYFEEVGQIFTTDLATSPTPVFAFEENKVKGLFHEERAAFDEPASESGSGLAFQQEGAGKGTFFSAGEVNRIEEHGKSLEPVNAVLGVQFEEGAPFKTSELGWTGGVASEEPKPCAIEFGNTYPLVAAGSGSGVFVLTSRVEPHGTEVETGEVLKLGPGGTGCPVAKALGEVEASIKGVKIVKPDDVNPVTLSLDLQGQANVLSTEWTFSDGSANATITTPTGQQTQAAEISHRFLKGGEITVHAKIHTDSLATPEIEVTTIFSVTEVGAEAPKLTGQPVGQEVVEGEGATFEATASGTPIPTVQWEVSTNGGGSWSAVAEATSNRLTIEKTLVPETGREYRAVFENHLGKAISNPAPLTVVAPAAPNVSVNPASVEVEEGQSASFEASATGKPAPSIEWDVRANPDATWHPVAGGSTGKLVLSGLTTAQSGSEYSALFKNHSGEQRSAAAILKVKAKLPVEKPPPVETPHENKVPPRATLAGASLSVSASGVLALKVSCQAGAPICTGTVSLRTAAAVSARAPTRAKKQILALAGGSFSLTGGQTKTISLRLSAKARKLLLRLHSLRARATLLSHDAAGETSKVEEFVTLRPAKRKH
jgi:hypothetical protein